MASLRVALKLSLAECKPGDSTTTPAVNNKKESNNNNNNNNNNYNGSDNKGQGKLGGDSDSSVSSSPSLI
eukprot:scaffold1172_cov180-Ochromonas_danica.AAC.38